MVNITGWGDTLALPVIPGRDHIRGAVDAPVSLLVYGDFECPFSGTVRLMVDAVQEEMGEMLQLVHRHFPLTTVHPHSWAAAEAAEAAGAQGAFWRMHDRLYEDQQHLAPADLLTRAWILGLEVDRFEEDMASHSYADRVQENLMSGVRSGVPGTPTFFVNGVRYQGPTTFEGLWAAVHMPLVRRA